MEPEAEPELPLEPIPAINWAALRKRAYLLVTAPKAYSLMLDLDHWHSVNPTEEQIELPLDLTFDVELRKAVDDEGSEEAV